jgi:AAA family ATPase
MPHAIAQPDLDAVADKTHGYVGADLSSLVREAGSIAIHRWIASGSTTTSPIMTNDDLHTALPTIRPSAMREVFIETPKVRWSDIGGQAVVKQKLRECVEWPLNHPETFTRLGVSPPRGILLYGPPGCSKTLTAKALATESGINFMAVKGPEVGQAQGGLGDAECFGCSCSTSLWESRNVQCEKSSAKHGRHRRPLSSL